MVVNYSQSDYNSPLFEDRNNVVSFDDTHLKQFSAKSCLNSSDVQQYSRMLFYVRKSVVSDNQTAGRCVAKSLNLSLNDFTWIEDQLFSIYSHTESLEKQETYDWQETVN